MTWVHIHTCEALKLVLRSMELGLFHRGAKLHLNHMVRVVANPVRKNTLPFWMDSVTSGCCVGCCLARLHSGGYKLAKHREKGGHVGENTGHSVNSSQSLYVDSSGSVSKREPSGRGIIYILNHFQVGLQNNKSLE